MSFYTPLLSTDDVTHTNVNSRLGEISDTIDNVLDGSQAQASPDILDFTGANHNHEDAAGGGQLTVASFASGNAPISQALTADGSSGATLESIVTSFLGLNDTPSSFANGSGQVLGVNSAEDALIIRNNYDSLVIEGDTDFTTTSTSFVDIDADDLSITITTVGGDVIVVMNFLVIATPTTPSEEGYFDLDVDGGRIGGDDGLSIIKGINSQVSFLLHISGLSAGSHTFKPQWKVSSGGTLTLFKGKPTSSTGVYGQFFVKEVA